MNIDIEEQEDNTIFRINQKVLTKVVDKEVLKAIEVYCIENNIIPNLIDKDKLDLVLRLGIQALNEREWNK